MNARAKVGDVEGADAHLRQMLRDNPWLTTKVSSQRMLFNDAIKACAKAGDADRGAQYFAEMRERAITPNLQTYGKLTEASARAGDPQAALKWVQQASDEGFLESAVGKLIVLSMLINGAAKFGDLQAAEDWFETVQEELASSTLSDEILPHLALACNSVMDAAAQVGNLETAEKWFEWGQRSGIPIDRHTFPILMNAAANRGNLAAAEQWYVKMREAGVPVNLVCFNTLVTAAGRDDDPGRAEYWFSEALAAGLEPDVVLYTALIAAVKKDPEIAEQWFEQAVEEGITPNTITYATLIDAWARAGDLGRAEKRYADMLGQGIQPNAVVFNSLMNAAAERADYDAAYRWLQEMVDMDIKPQVTTWTTLLKACANAWSEAKNKKWQRTATSVFQSMVEGGLTPSKLTLKILATVLGWKKVQSFCDSMDLDFDKIMSANFNPRQQRHAEAWTPETDNLRRIAREVYDGRLELPRLRGGDRGGRLSDDEDEPSVPRGVDVVDEPSVRS